MFPEGTRCSGLVVNELKDGVAYLSLRAGVPIVPVGIGGSERAMPRGAKFPRPRRINVFIGPAVPVPDAVLPPGANGDEAGDSAPEKKRARVGRAAISEQSDQVRAAIQAAFDAAEATLRD
jgi:1-acyl-sn-glycerol-3-phosphate acyltransferase